jgi:hypothetical protein
MRIILVQLHVYTYKGQCTSFLSAQKIGRMKTFVLTTHQEWNVAFYFFTIVIVYKTNETGILCK